jgi:hypothetical protein
MVAEPVVSQRAKKPRDRSDKSDVGSALAAAPLVPMPPQDRAHADDRSRDAARLLRWRCWIRPQSRHVRQAAAIRVIPLPAGDGSVTDGLFR